MAKGAFSRISDILKSNINEMLDRAEEPDKMIRQMVRDMEEAVGKATASVGTAVANHKRLERQFNDKQSQVAEWQGKAERAVEAGEDALARRALERKEEQSLVFIEVEDDGPGIEEEHLELIFEPGFTTRERGNGYGLSIARRIVQAHQGVLRVKSRKGHGTVFRLDLPLNFSGGGT
ncbi:MAG: hypothetical protein F4049_13115 [Gemmatimonadetes bacterium]|nr:hypothetical protein [Gemmatimonadota bacterium]